MEPGRKALVVGPGHTRGGLAGCRGLAAAGWEVGVGYANDGGALSKHSRVVSRSHEVPMPNRDPEGFVDAIADAVETFGYRLIFGAGDSEALALASLRDRIPGRVAHVDRDVMLQATDKSFLARVGEQAGLRSPQSFEPAPGEPIDGDHPVWRSGSVVVKARLHAPGMADPGAAGAVTPARLEAQLCRSPSEAQAAIGEMMDAGGAPIVQEAIRGELVALSLVLDPDGECLAMSQQTAGAIWPADGGVSARARTVEVDSELLSRCLAMLREIGWTGLAQVQFLEAGEGDLRLIDLNGRFYGSLALAMAAGANLPGIWADSLEGRKPDVVPVVAEPGRNYQWLEGEIRFRRARGASWPRAIGGSLLRSPGSAHAAWSWSDPLPTVRRGVFRARQKGKR